MTANKKIPALRFKEFEEEWKERKLGEFGEFKGGGTPSTTNGMFWSGHIPWISSSDLVEGNIRYLNISRYITLEAVEKSATKIVPPKSILIVSRVGVGKVAINETEICTSQDFQNLILNDGDYVFLALLIQIKTKELLGFNQGTSIKGFVKNDLIDFSIKVPFILEQQKIANFLTSVDDKIQQLTKKKALLEQYKKGVMQQIFNQQIRFKDDDGNDYLDWEEKKLGSIFSFIPSNSFSRSELNYTKGSVQTIHYGDIHTKYKANFDITKEIVPFLNEDIDTEKIPEENYCKQGDLIVADASEDYNDIGKAIEIINLENKKLTAGLHTYILRDNSNITATGFKGYLMKSYSVRVQMMKMATGISVLGITKANLSKVKIHLPVKKEQKKIANFLTGIDNKINLVNQQLEKTKEFKKGLLQGMFV